ncbi:SDR family oxidoreductase [Alteromonas sediminis]|uniref:SDR family oxidoreductase n=1 Tax=Alteromonas sediminis TaxID=2259342 RepID=A0A3N5Y2Y4_9ALTE|nr:SDR family oxidoreductase [Alteromonas sediminis]RPJ67056.1 SDR family oxidoreductase [Alteromonas sediminis]
MANVVIIGANRGIGLELAKQYAVRGDTVIAVCRKASAPLLQVGCEVIEHVDVSDDQLVDSLAARIPVNQIDTLIHNAGILKSDTLATINMDTLREHFEINTLAPLKTVLALKSKLAPKSKVGLVTSRVGSIADNSSGNNYAYRVSKTALNMVGKCLSIDLAADGIAVALLHPGYVRTEMTNGNGLIEPDESASGLIARMDDLSLETSGIFIHSSGEVLPW